MTSASSSKRQAPAEQCVSSLEEEILLEVWRSEGRDRSEEFLWLKTSFSPVSGSLIRHDPSVGQPCFAFEEGLLPSALLQQPQPLPLPPRGC